MTFLFIPSLLAGDRNTFMSKIAIVVVFWLIAIFASLIDLVSGIMASRRLGIKRTTSFGLRKTLSKDLQYIQMLAMLLLIDVCLSVLQSHVSAFGYPVLSMAGVFCITMIEAVSVIENSRKGKSEQEDKIDDLRYLAEITIGMIGSDRITEFSKEIKRYAQKKTGKKLGRPRKIKPNTDSQVDAPQNNTELN